MSGQPPDNGLDRPTDRPDSHPDTAPDSPVGMSVAEAAAILHVTSDALYKGLDRGTYKGEKTRNGRWIVYLDRADIPPDPSRSAPDASERATGPSMPHDQTAGLERLVDSLEDQIRHLRADLIRRDEQLSETRRQHEEELRRRDRQHEAEQEARREERKRLDLIIRQLEDVRQLPASTQTPPTDERRSWWRRLFGIT